MACRILLQGQADARDNGIWLVTTGKPTRPLDFEDGNHVSGVYVFVDQGYDFIDRSFVCTTDKGSDTVGANHLEFQQFGARPAAYSGEGLNIGPENKLYVDHSFIPYLAKPNTFTQTNIFQKAVTARETLQVDGAITLNNSLNVADGKSATLGGSLQVKGATNLDDALTVEDGKSATLGGSLQVKGVTGLEDALTVADRKSATLGGSLQVKGITNLDDVLTVADGKSATLGGSLQVKGATNLDDALTVADGKSATLGGSLQVKGVTGLDDALTVADGKSATLGGSLQVKGVTGLDDALTVADGKSAALGGSLQVKGVTGLDDALTVADGKSATLGGSLQVKGATNLDDALTVVDGKSATLGGSLQVKGATNLDDALTVADEISTTLGGSLQVKGVTGLEDALTVADGKSATLGGSLQVKGITNLDDAVTVADGKSATLGGSLQVKGATNLDDALTVEDGKSATLGGSLQVKGVTGLYLYGSRVLWVKENNTYQIMTQTDFKTQFAHLTCRYLPRSRAGKAIECTGSAVELWLSNPEKWHLPANLCPRIVRIEKRWAAPTARKPIKYGLSCISERHWVFNEARELAAYYLAESLMYKDLSYDELGHHPDVQFFENFLEKLILELQICEYNLNWLAHFVQYPGVLPLTFLFLISEFHGVGKNVYTSFIVAMVGFMDCFLTERINGSASGGSFTACKYSWTVVVASASASKLVSGPRRAVLPSVSTYSAQH